MDGLWKEAPQGLLEGGLSHLSSAAESLAQNRDF